MDDFHCKKKKKSINLVSSCFYFFPPNSLLLYFGKHISTLLIRFFQTNRRYCATADAKVFRFILHVTDDYLSVCVSLFIAVSCVESAAAGGDLCVSSLLEPMTLQSFRLMAPLTLPDLGIIISCDLGIWCHRHETLSLLINHGLCCVLCVCVYVCLCCSV